MKYLNLMKEKRDALLAQRDTLVAKMETITRSVEADGRDNLSAAETKEFRALKSELGRLDVDINSAEERVAELQEVADRAAKAADVPTVIRHGHRGLEPWDLARDARPGDDLRSLARDCVARTPAVDDEVRERITRALDEEPNRNTEGLAEWAIATSDPEYLRAFGKLLADPMTASVRMSDREAAAFHRVATVQRAMSLTDSAGGYMVPMSLDPAVLLTGNGVNESMRRIARQVTITTDVWYPVTSAGITASWDTETETVSDDSATLAQPSIVPHNLRAFVPYSINVGMDAVNFAEEMAKLIRDEFAVKEGTAVWTGSGSAQPYGVVAALDANTNVEVALVDTTSGAYALADVYALHEAVPARFRGNASWAGNINMINKTRRFGEGTSGSNSAFWADLGSGKPPELLGSPIYEASPMDAYAASGSKNLLVYGDFSRYVIVDRVGTTIELVPHLFDVTNNRPTAQRGFFAYKRVGGDVVTDEAFRLLKGKS